MSHHFSASEPSQDPLNSENYGGGPEHKRKITDMTSAVSENKRPKMSEGEICNYCMQEINAEQDPRKLPCGHIFCLSCLKDDFVGSGASSHRCTTCKIVHQDVDFDSLPTVEITDKPSQVAEELTTKSTVLYCDRCLDEPAVGYCNDCGEKSCAHHMEHHEGYYEGTHETIGIAKFIMNPSLYNKAAICPEHSDSITMACKNCYQYNCIECCEGKTFCEVNQGDHSYYPLDAIEKKIKQKFTELLQQTASKLAEIERLDKEVWNKHNELLVECEEMIAEVEEESTKQLAVINTRTQELKEAIQQYKDETEEKVLKFSTELIDKREEIEEVRKTTHKSLCNKHVSELIKIMQEKVAVLEKTNATNLGSYEWVGKFLYKGSQSYTKLELKFKETKRSSTPYCRTTRPSFNFSFQVRQK